MTREMDAKCLLDGQLHLSWSEADLHRRQFPGYNFLPVSTQLVPKAPCCWEDGKTGNEAENLVEGDHIGGNKTQKWIFTMSRNETDGKDIGKSQESSEIGGKCKRSGREKGSCEFHESLKTGHFDDGGGRNWKEASCDGWSGGGKAGGTGGKGRRMVDPERKSERRRLEEAFHLLKMTEKSCGKVSAAGDFVPQNTPCYESNTGNKDIMINMEPAPLTMYDVTRGKAIDAGSEENASPNRRMTSHAYVIGQIQDVDSPSDVTDTSSMTSDSNENTESLIHEVRMKLDPSNLQDEVSQDNPKVNAKVEGRLEDEEFTGFDLAGTLKGHQNAVTDCHFLKFHILTSSLDSTIRLWDKGRLDEVKVIACHSPIHSVLCVKVDCSTLSTEAVLVMAATETGHLEVCRLELAGTGHITASAVVRLVLHLPNPIVALARGSEGDRLCTGCCFLKYDLAGDGVVRRTARGTVRVWTMSEIVKAGLGSTGLEEDVKPICVRTSLELLNSITSNKQEIRHERDHSCGVSGLSFSPDGTLLAVGLGHPTAGTPAAASGDPTLVLCCPETLTVVWAFRENCFSTSGIRFLKGGTGNRRSPWQLIVATERSLSNIAVYRKKTKLSKGCQNNGRQQDVVARCLWLQQFEQRQQLLHVGVEVSWNEKVIASAIKDVPIFWDLSSGTKLTTLVDPGGSSSDQHSYPDLRILKVSISDTMDTVVCGVANGCATVWRREGSC